MNMDPSVPDLDALSRAVEARNEAMGPLVAEIARLRAEVAAPGADQGARSQLAAAEQRARDANVALRLAVDQREAALGLPDGMLDEIERRRAYHDPVDRSPRSAVAAEHIPPGGFVDDHLPAVLAYFESVAPTGWLHDQAAHEYGLGSDFLLEPLSLVRGIRVKSERRSIHRLAQSILVCRDLRESSHDYDMFAGALAVPQLVSLAGHVDDFARMRGNVAERIRRLWERTSDDVDSTMYELLVAAACAAKGRDVEFLEERQTKTPDIRIHDLAVPVVVECKRKRPLSVFDIADDDAMRALYYPLRSACTRRGMYGVVAVKLTIPPTQIDASAIVEATMQLRLAIDSRVPIEHPWGTIGFFPVKQVVKLPLTRLYSPDFLLSVFGWNTDMPSHDGLVCQVRAVSSMLIEEARDPLALVWIDETADGVRRRARTAAALFGQAIRQIPPGDMGIVYVGYQEGDRPAVADDRTAFLRQQLQEWEHSQHVRVPASIMSRIIPRPMGGGAPDLVETGLQFSSALYGAPEWFDALPTLMFTPSGAKR